MKTKPILLILFLLLSACIQANRQTVYLNGEWQFRTDRDSTGWKSWYKGIPGSRTVTVPHTWNVEDGTERYYGLGWYEKKINIPSDWKEKEIRLHFEAVYRDVVVYVNGKEIGINRGAGYTPFSFNVNKYLKYGADNSIILSVSNKISKYALPYDAKFDWPNDGGIIRPVSFVITEKPSVRYAHIKTETNFKDSTATGEIRLKTWEDNVKNVTFKLTFSEYNSNKVITEEQFKLKAENGIFIAHVNFNKIRPWHFDSPMLYVMKVDVISGSKVTDTYTTRFGFRKFEIKGHEFFLNEEAVRLPGIEYMPGSYPAYGMAEPVEVMKQAVEAMKDLNCVITRFHWQQDYRILDMMDEKGILVQQEIPWWQAPGNLTPELEELAKKHIDCMIERDFNRPCIFSWGVSNEVFYNTDKDIYRRLIAHAKAWDTGSMVAVVSNEIYSRLENDESLLADIPTWNDYVGTWHGKFREETPEMLDLINKRALRGRPLLITEHGLCEPRFVGGDPRRVIEMAYHYDQWSKNDYIMGCIYFSLNDYRTHVGESGKGRYQQRVHGLTDLWFGRKPSFEIYRGLASPVYFESVQQLPKGTEAEVTIVVKDNLPKYTLKNYKLVWLTSNGKEQEMLLLVLKPGEKFKTTITGLNPTAKPVLKVVRPTGYSIAQYD